MYWDRFGVHARLPSVSPNAAFRPPPGRSKLKATVISGPGHGDRHKILSLNGEAFVQRFLLHVLPKGLMRIRHYGFLANRCRHDKLARIRRALAALPPETTSETADTVALGYPCPKCRRGTLRVVATLPPRRLAWAPPG